MTKSNLMFIENGYAILVLVSDDEIRAVISTSKLHESRYIKNETNNKQLCYGGATMGQTLEYSSDAQLAKDCNARLFKTKSGFERAKSNLIHAY